MNNATNYNVRVKGVVVAIDTGKISVNLLCQKAIIKGKQSVNKQIRMFA